MTDTQKTCKVCWAPVDDEGFINHGRGCYTQSLDGGGAEYVGLPGTVTQNEDKIKTGCDHLIPEGGFKKGHIAVYKIVFIVISSIHSTTILQVVECMLFIFFVKNIE